MKSYDDLQRFKEKTQTNHIEFKEMSDTTLNSDSANWAIIKQLLNDGSGTVLDNSQRIDQVAPQPVDPATFAKPASAPVPPVSAAPAAPATSSNPLPPPVIRAEPVTQNRASSGSLLAQLAADSSLPAQAPAAAQSVTAESAPQTAAAAQPTDGVVLAKSGADVFNQLAAAPGPADLPHTAAPQPAVAPVAQQPTSPLYPPVGQGSAPQQSLYPPVGQGAAPQQPLYPPVAQSAPQAAAPYYAPAVPQQAAPPQYAPFNAQSPAAVDAPASGSFRQLFSSSPASASAAQAQPKDTLLKPLLEKIASCR